AQARHPQHGALLHPSRDLDLDSPATGQLDGPARTRVHLAQAYGDRRLDVDLLLARAAAGVAEDRPEDVAESRALAEQVFHVLRPDGPVLDARPGDAAPTAASATDASGALHVARLRAGRLRGSPVLAEVVIQSALFGVGRDL